MRKRKDEQTETLENVGIDGQIPERPYLYMIEVRKFFGYKSGGHLMGCSRQTIERHFDNGLKKSWLGGKVVVWKDDLTAYLAFLHEQSKRV